MSSQDIELDELDGSVLGLIADAHIHPDNGVALPDAVLDAFRGVDAIVALGDMGEPSVLDALSRAAPLFAVRGLDDAAGDARVRSARRVISNGRYTLGAVFDGTRHGLLESSDPFAAVAGLEAAVRAAFGTRVDVLLCASSHKPFVAQADGVLVVNPGSPTLAETRTVARLTLGANDVSVEHIVI